MVRFAASSPELSSAAVENGYSRTLNLHKPITCLRRDGGESSSTTHGTSLLVNLKCWRSLFIDLKWEMGAALVDSLPFAHQNVKPLTTPEKSVSPHEPGYKIICKDVSS